MANKNDISLIEIINQIKQIYKHLITKWLIILIVGLSGGVIGLISSFVFKPKYVATLSFALIEKTPGGSGLAALASSFGLSGLMGGSQSAFSGDNLLEIIKSEYAIEQTLLSTVDYKGKKQKLVDIYIETYDLRNTWRWQSKPELKNIEFPVNQNRENFTRVQDSILQDIYKTIKETKSLSVIRKDKRVDIVNLTYKSTNEIFSKLFAETLINQTYDFYKESKIAQNKLNIRMMEHTADSIKGLYESALYKGAGYSQININEAMQYAAVPKLKQQANAQLYGTVYAEVLKNLETLKLDLARETPIMQIIDVPRYPLEKKRLGPYMGIALGGLLGGVLIVIYLIVRLRIKSILEKQSNL